MILDFPNSKVFLISQTSCHGTGNRTPPVWGPRSKFHMSRRSQTIHFYEQTATDGTYLCPDFCAFRNYCTFFVRSKDPFSDFCRLKITHDHTFLRSRPKNVRSNIETLCVHVQTFVGSKKTMSRILCIVFCVLDAFRSAYVQSFMLSCPYLLPVFFI